MLKKHLLSLVLLFCCFQSVAANELNVIVEPVKKITTSNINLSEGDEINFVVAKDVYKNSDLYIKRGSPVVGVVTSIENNDFLYKEASLYAENFRLKDTNGKKIKLNGVIYKKGSNHSMLTQFIPLPIGIIRGGEVQIKPKKDTYTFFLEDI